MLRTIMITGTAICLSLGSSLALALRQAAQDLVLAEFPEGVAVAVRDEGQRADLAAAHDIEEGFSAFAVFFRPANHEG